MQYSASVSELEPLGSEIRRRRAAQGLTLRTLAERSGLSLRFLSDLEHGRGNISVGKLLRVARALEVKPSELVSTLDAMPEGVERSRPRHVALVGLRGAGKSTIGARLARALGARFVELDHAIETRAGLPLSQIFELHGETYYRRLERDVLTDLLQGGGRALVIATGGGLVTDPESWQLLQTHTHTIWLSARPEDHLGRVQAQGDLRPMRHRPAAMAELRALLGLRSPLYSRARLTVDTSELGVEGSLEAIMRSFEPKPAARPRGKPSRGSASS